jgi:hypothetical protein
MGKMKLFLLVGFEWWGKLKPAQMWTKKGHCYIPLILGIWIRWPFQDKNYLNLRA